MAMKTTKGKPARGARGASKAKVYEFGGVPVGTKANVALLTRANRLAKAKGIRLPIAN